MQQAKELNRLVGHGAKSNVVNLRTRYNKISRLIFEISYTLMLHLSALLMSSIAGPQVFLSDCDSRFDPQIVKSNKPPIPSLQPTGRRAEGEIPPKRREPNGNQEYNMSYAQASLKASQAKGNKTRIRQPVRHRAESKYYTLPTDVLEAMIKPNKSPLERAALENSKWATLNSQIALDQIDKEIGNDKHATKCIAIPIRNPEAFPIQQLQEVQAQLYPNTRITDMVSHLNAETGFVFRVTADLVNGSINHLIINDMRLITALGLRAGENDTITLDQSKLRVNETYLIRILTSEGAGDPQDPRTWLAGELVSARHPYLYWLDLKGNADPFSPPLVREVEALARQLGRRVEDVRYEIECVHKLENGLGPEYRDRYRGHRGRWLGEDPKYDGNGKRVD